MPDLRPTEMQLRHGNRLATEIGCDTAKAGDDEAATVACLAGRRQRIAWGRDENPDERAPFLVVAGDCIGVVRRRLDH